MKKRKILSFILSMSIISNLILSTTNVYATQLTELEATISISDKSEIVIIPDTNLKKALNSELNQSENSSITKNQLKLIRHLSINYSSIENLEGLQYCTNLDYLDLSDNQISDISALSGLTNLQSLNLGWNQISDISSLSGLTNLQLLDLGWNQISDISSLKDLTNLTTLNLGDNKIIDISLLNNLSNLTSLSLYSNTISEIKSLNLLHHLNFLDLSNNQITDISALNNLSNLSYLDLRDNQISDINALNSLFNLTSLALDNNQISNISALSNLNNIAYLSLRNQRIELPQMELNTTSIEIKNKIINGDGEVIQPNYISNNGVYNPETQLIKWDNINSDYKKLTYSFKDVSTEFSGTVTQPIKYISNAKPVISGVENITIKQGSDFKIMEGVTATDKEDKDLTESIKVTGEVNTNIPGKYELTYEVTDSDNNTVTAKRIVTVLPRLSVINKVPTIIATDKVLTVGDAFNPLDGITAHDNEDGDITLTEANVISNNVDISKAGTYTVIYKVTDKKGASTLKTIIVTVQEKIVAPEVKPENKPIENQNEDSNINSSKPDRLPQTGDATNMGLLSLIFIGSGGMLVGLNRKKYKK